MRNLIGFLVVGLMGGCTASGISIPVPAPAQADNGVKAEPGDPAGFWADEGPFHVTNLPECERQGIRVVGIKEGSLNGGFGFALFMQVFNKSGKRMWIQADVKYSDTGQWETTQPFTLRADEKEGFQVIRPIRHQGETQVTDINVLKCGT